MNTEAQNWEQGQIVDYTPGSARHAGDVVQVDDGRAAICVDEIAASVQGSAQVRGTIKARAAAVTGNAGDIVGWDEDGDPYGGTAGTGAVTTKLTDADFLLGRLVTALTATDGEAVIELNIFGNDNIKMTLVKLTAAQIKALAATQQTLVAAPGADRVIQVLGIQMILDYGSEVLAEPSAPDDLEVVYGATGGPSVADVIGDFVISSADTIAQPQIKNIAGSAAADMVNKAILLDNTGGEYTGNASNDTTLTIITTYKVHRCELA